MMRDRRRPRRLAAVMTICAVMTAAAALLAALPSFSERMDRVVYDIFVRSRAARDPVPSSGLPVIVSIDGRSISKIGQWPWPRYVTARLIERLREAGVSVIAANILLANADQTSPGNVAEQLSRFFGAAVDVSGVPSGLIDNDIYLANEIARGRVVLCAGLTDDAGDVPYGALRQYPVVEIREPGAPHLSELVPVGAGITMPFSRLAAAAACCAMFDDEGGVDGVFRSVTMISGYGGVPLVNIALASLALHDAVSSGSQPYDRPIIAGVSRRGGISLRAAGVTIPLSRGGEMGVSFRSGEACPSYSAIDVLTGSVGRAELEGRIAIVGATAVGFSGHAPTPVDPHGLPPALYASAIDTIMARRFIVEPDWPASIAAAVAAGLIVSAAFGSLGLYAAFPCGAFVVMLLWFGAQWLFSLGIFVSPAPGILIASVDAALAAALRMFVDERDVRVLRRAFSSYVAPEVVESIAERGGLDSLIGETRDITVLFTDLRGFTHISERMEPEALSSMLGAYFTPMTAIVRASGGTVDKFVGDAMMAFWNAPLDVPLHETAAVRALLDMRRGLDALNDDFEGRYGVRLTMGGGINTGRAQVGNMGTPELVNYTAIGDTVNTASRLEGMCERYGVGIVISGSTASALDVEGMFALRRLDVVRVKGRETPVPLFTVCDADEADRRREEMALWEEAFSLYQAGDFVGAREMCRMLERSCPSEKLYSVFAERADRLARSEMRPGEWDGVFVYSAK